jgi:hypothetical protein
MSIFVAVVGAVLALGAVGYFVFVKRHPQNAAGDPTVEVRSASEQFFGERNDRPGGPGSEADGVVGPGRIAPGASAEAGGDSEPSWPDAQRTAGHERPE